LPRNLGAAAASGRADEQSWGVRVAHGDFDGVIEDAERRGIDKALAESSAVDLAALADAARYARRQDVARRALMAQRTRYPGSVQARDAPFFLGGLSEGQKNDTASLEWYDVYLRESANGAYASQALGRKLMLVQRLQSSDAARPIATEYLARFPEGPYAPSARKLLQAQ
jgi:TolA-binding protein